MEKKYTLLKVNELLLLPFIWMCRFYDSVEIRRHVNTHSCLPVYLLCWIHAGVRRNINGVRGEKRLQSRFPLFHTALPRECPEGCENPIGWFYMDKSSFGNWGLSGQPCLRCRGAWRGKVGNFKVYLQTTVQQELGLMLLQPFAPLPYFDLSPASSTPLPVTGDTW